MDIWKLRPYSRTEPTVALTNYSVLINDDKLIVRDPEGKIRIERDISNGVELFYDEINNKVGLRLNSNGNIFDLVSWNATTGEGTGGDLPSILIAEKMKLSTLDQNPIGNNLNMQVEGLNDCDIWFKAGNNPSDHVNFFMTEKGNVSGCELMTLSDGTLWFASGTDADTLSGKFRFCSGRLVNNGPADRPSFTGSTDIITMDKTVLNSFVPINMNSNSITNISNFQTSQITSNQYISNFDTSKKIEFIDGGTFDDIFNIVVPRTIINGYVDLPSISTPPNSGITSISGRLYCNNQLIRWKTLAGDTNLLNPYNQDLTTSGSPSFQGMTLTNIPLDASALKSLYLDNSNIVKYKNQYVGTANSLSLSTTTSTTYVNKTNFVATANPAGLYRISVYCEMGNDNRLRESYLQLRINGTPVITDITKCPTDNNSAKVPMNINIYQNLSAGPNTFSVDYRASVNTAEIRNVYIIVEQLN